MKDFFTVPEAARKLNITDRACWMRVYRQQIPYKRWGKRVVIPVAELQRFMEALPGISAEEAVAKVEATVK